MFKQVLMVMGFWSLMSPSLATSTPVEYVDIPMTAQSIKSGAEVVTSVCMVCHSLKYIRYRDLLSIGLDLQSVTTLRGQHALESGLTALMDHEALLATFALVPPDLSLITKTRRQGDQYVYALLSAYHEDDKGQIKNTLNPDTRMPDVLSFGSVKNETDRKVLLGNLRDVTAFLNWSADPNEMKRHRLGYYVIGYLVIYTLLMYALKRREWAKLGVAAH